MQQRTFGGGERSTGAEGPSTGAEGPVIGAEGPVTGAEGPMISAEGPMTGAPLSANSFRTPRTPTTGCNPIRITMSRVPTERP